MEGNLSTGGQSLTPTSRRTVKVRRFMPSDMEKLREIEAASIRYVTPLSSLLSFYKIPSEGFLVAENEGKIVGYAVGNVRTLPDGREEGHILDIAVAPDYRKQGIGTALITSLIDMFRNQGLRSVALEVKFTNSEARKFYSRLGFAQSYIARRYYRMRGYTEDAVIMKKTL